MQQPQHSSASLAVAKDANENSVSVSSGSVCSERSQRPLVSILNVQPSFSESMPMDNSSVECIVVGRGDARRQACPSTHRLPVFPQISVLRQPSPRGGESGSKATAVSPPFSELGATDANQRWRNDDECSLSAAQSQFSEGNSSRLNDVRVTATRDGSKDASLFSVDELSESELHQKK